jgi:hypothetical protein
MADDDPNAELSRLLSEESLEDRFHRVMISVFRRISDGGYYPAGDLLKEVEDGNGVDFAKHWLRDDRAQPLFELLQIRGRNDLTVEWYVARSPYLNLFDKDERVVYSQRFRDAKQLQPILLLRSLGDRSLRPSERESAEQAIANLKADKSYAMEDLIKLQRRRAAEFASLPIPDQIGALEREVESGYPFTCSGRIVREGKDPRLRDHHPLVASGINNVPQLLREVFQDDLEIFRPVFDFSREKVAAVDELLHRSSECEDLSAEKVLYFRAAFLCSLHGRSVPQIAAIFLGGESDEDEIRDLASYFCAPDGRLLVAAAILSRMFAHEGLFSFRVISFGDLPESAVVRHELFDPEKPDREGLDDQSAMAVSVDAVVRFVTAYAARLVESRQALILPPALSISNANRETFPTSVDGAPALPWETMLELAGEKKRADAERKLRDKMGTLFDQLCPEAKSSLLGAQFTLLDERWHPGPSQALVAMSTAFEWELKESFLVPLAEFLASTENRYDFPKEHNVISDGSPKPRLTLDQVLTATRKERGVDFRAVQSALRKVKDRRNTSAHEGTTNFETVRECFESWLDPILGVFSVLFPRSQEAHSA